MRDRQLWANPRRRDNILPTARMRDHSRRWLPREWAIIAMAAIMLRSAEALQSRRWPPRSEMSAIHIAPQPRGFRATPDDIMANPDRGTLAQRSRLLNMLATLADRYGVQVPRGPRGGIQDKRLLAALARAAQTNPELQAEMPRMGLWSTVIAAGGLGAASMQPDPLAGISPQ